MAFYWQTFLALIWGRPKHTPHWVQHPAACMTVQSILRNLDFIMPRFWPDPVAAIKGTGGRLYGVRISRLAMRRSFMLEMGAVGPH